MRCSQDLEELDPSSHANKHKSGQTLWHSAKAFLQGWFRLPQRSQAYAATLCWAARHAFSSADPARAEAIYRRYVATGAYQPWAKNFGRDCVEPDFADQIG